MVGQDKIFRVTVSSSDVEHFLAACEAAEWYAFDTGERVMTDEGPDAEAVLLVETAAVVPNRVATAIAQ